MSLKRELSSYIERITGRAHALRQLPPDCLRGLPAFLVSGCRFHEWAWMDQKVIVVEDNAGPLELSPTDVKARLRPLMDYFKKPVVFVYAGLEAYQRNRLVHLGVPFIVPGLQLFLPPFASFTEQFQRISKAGALSAAAQATVLRQILRRPPDRTLLNQWAERLGYSAMTMTKVRDELVGCGLCERAVGAKPRGLRFLRQGRALWDAARPFLRSPVRRSSWARLAAPPEPLLPAGLTALAKMSLIEDDPLPTYACRESAWKRLIAAQRVRAVGHPEEADARVEQWRYDPGLPAADGAVDHLSLYLSFADASDERVRLAADSLLEHAPW